MSSLTHFDNNGKAIMVDVSNKPVTHRIATAAGKIAVNADAYQAIINGTSKKGDVLGTARLAGIMASKRTSDLIPLCHPLPISKCTVDFTLLPEESAIEASAAVKVAAQTGVEMEALHAVSTALLTIYDMCKALDKNMTISDIRLLEKNGGRSGHFIRTEA